ncbi:MAG: sugar transferase [Butyrivibrio sp.]|nr:sugar transferase [Butyrivibrio sp.]
MSLDNNKKTSSSFRFKYMYRVLCVGMIEAICTMLFTIIWLDFVIENNQTGHLTGLGNILMSVGVYFGLLTFCMYEFKGYKIGVNRKMNVISSQIAAICMTGIFEVFISMAVTGEFRFFSAFLWRYALMCLVESGLAFIFGVLLTNLYRKIFPPLRVVELYQNGSKLLMNKMNTRPDKYNVCEAICITKDLSNIRDEIKKYDAVLINDLDSEIKNDIIKICYDIDKRIYYVPKISDIIMKSSESLNLFDTPLQFSRNIGLSFRQRIFKRFMDVIISTIGLIVGSPIFLIVAIAIKLEDGGPVFYRQDRCTYNGKIFSIIKFRSMKVDTDKTDKFRPVGENDDRITGVGRFIRPHRIDELPQLINILKGEMSVVGPRPEVLRNVKKYSKDISEFTFRTKIKAGLTGYAQVYGKYNTSPLDKLKMDLMYITNYSILLDIQILFETVKVVFKIESTEAFSEEKQNELISFEELSDKYM